MFKWLTLRLWITTLLVVGPGVSQQPCKCFVNEYGSPYCEGDNNGNCTRYEKCSTQCYCGSNSKFCTSDGEGCIPNSHTCCGWGWSWCISSGSCQREGECNICSTGQKWCEGEGKCIQNDQPCCASGRSWCSSTQTCPPTGECCSTGLKWCASEGKCISNAQRCCVSGTSWCSSTSSCKPNGECCNSGTRWCGTNQGGCVPKEQGCCGWGKRWCRSTGSCQLKHQCCDDGFSWCKNSVKCIPNNEKCCNSTENWCDKSKSCIPKDQICKSHCGEDSYLCNKTNSFIPNEQVCEYCKTGKVTCATPNSYRCYSIPTFNLALSLKVCQDGICRRTSRNWDCEESVDGCQAKTYKCGEECKPNKEFVNFRTCEGRCIRRNETCTREKKDRKKNGNLLETITIVSLSVFGVFVIIVIFFCRRHFKKKNDAVLEETEVVWKDGEVVIRDKKGKELDDEIIDLCCGLKADRKSRLGAFFETIRRYRGKETTEMLERNSAYGYVVGDEYGDYVSTEIVDENPEYAEGSDEEGEAVIVDQNPLYGRSGID